MIEKLLPPLYEVYNALYETQNRTLYGPPEVIGPGGRAEWITGVDTVLMFQMRVITYDQLEEDAKVET